MYALYAFNPRPLLSYRLANSTLLLRLKQFYVLMGVTPDPKQIKVDAWFLKKGCVLAKKKVTRQQYPRDGGFYDLMKAACHEEQEMGSFGGVSPE